jgi:soluble lytic murein transglycosylase-like protein
MYKRRRKGERFSWLFVIVLWIYADAPEIRAQNSNLDDAALERARLYEASIKESAERYGVNARLLWAIAYLETRFNPTLVSRKGARGLMQFMPGTAASYRLADPHDPIAAIDAAARYVRDLGARFKRADLVLAAYNAGEATVEAYLTGHSIPVGSQVINPKGLRTGGIPPYRETREYVERGLKILKELSQLSPRADEELTNQAVRTRNSMVRQSLRADGTSGGFEIGQIEFTEIRNRRSIYFGQK